MVKELITNLIDNIDTLSKEFFAAVKVWKSDIIKDPDNPPAASDALKSTVDAWGSASEAAGALHDGVKLAGAAITDETQVILNGINNLNSALFETKVITESNEAVDQFLGMIGVISKSLKLIIRNIGGERLEDTEKTELEIAVEHQLETIRQ